MIQGGPRVTDVDLAVPIEVGALLADRFRASQEEVVRRIDDIAEVPSLSSTIRLSTTKTLDGPESALGASGGPVPPSRLIGTLDALQTHCGAWDNDRALVSAPLRVRCHELNSSCRPRANELPSPRVSALRLDVLMGSRAAAPCELFALLRLRPARVDRSAQRS